MEARRWLLALIIRHVRPDLLALAHLEPAQVAAFADDELLQCLRELDLLGDPLSTDAAHWWESLISLAALADQSYLKTLGDSAEAATVAYERKRLCEAGRLDLSDHVVWVSRLDEASGFDVLSYVGPSDDAPPETRLRIEVKACGAFHHRFRFFLSRHEWEVSYAELPYVFHLWRVADLAMSSPHPLAIVSAACVHSWVPTDRPPSGFWTDSYIEPPDDFREAPIATTADAPVEATIASDRQHAAG